MPTDTGPVQEATNAGSPTARCAVRRRVVSRRTLAQGVTAIVPVVLSLTPSPARARMSHASALGSHAKKTGTAPAAPAATPTKGS